MDPQLFGLTSSEVQLPCSSRGSRLYCQRLAHSFNNRVESVLTFNSLVERRRAFIRSGLRKPTRFATTVHLLDTYQHVRGEYNRWQYRDGYVTITHFWP